MADVVVGEASEFLEHGGVMSAPMSTSKDLTTAMRYAASEQCRRRIEPGLLTAPAA